MTERPYHHGDLRAVLLAEAERTVREEGMDALSLRELARRAGVSHGAPRRHFADRRSLLDALVVAGFARLTAEMRAAMDGDGEDFPGRFRAGAHAYARFAVQDGALLALMLEGKRTGTDAAAEAALAFFSFTGELVEHGQRSGDLRQGDPFRVRLLLVALLDGVAALVTSGRGDDAVDLLLVPRG